MTSTIYLACLSRLRTISRPIVQRAPDELEQDIVASSLYKGCEILSKRSRNRALLTGISPACSRSIMCIQRKVGIPRNGEVVHRKRVQRLGCFDLRRHGLHAPELGQAVRYVKDEDDEQAVCGSFDLKVSEEGVCTEEIESFVYYVCLVWIR